MVLTQKTAPTLEPVTLVEAKAHLKVTRDTENPLIAAYIRAAREYAEIFTGRQLVTATWQLYLDTFPAYEIRLPRPPLSSVGSIKYNDVDGAQQTWSNTEYDQDTKSEPGRVALAYGESFPNIRGGEINTIIVEYDAGYAATAGPAVAAVPAPFKAAILLMVADLYEHRMSQSEIRITPNVAVDRLLWAKRIVEVV